MLPVSEIVACSVNGCSNAAHCRGFCNTHYSRWRTTGSPLRDCPTCGKAILERGLAVYCSKECRPRCSVEGCDGPVRKTGWCASHYAQWKRIGTVKPFGYKWATERVCVVCGAEVQAGTNRRQHCSPGCQQTSSRWGKPALPSRAATDPARPRSADCARCGTTINLLARNKKGRMPRTDVRLCRRCKQQSRYPMSTPELALRDGVGCGICGDLVDFSLPPKSRMAPSVDHIHPRALGGSDDPTNLQLAHLRCNQIKNDRPAFVGLASST